MEIILFMTLSGSLLFLMLSLICYFKPELFNLNKKYKLLKISLLLHFLPLPALMFFVKSLAIKIVPDKILNTINTDAYYGYEKVLILQKEVFSSTKAFFYEFSILGLWIFISISVLIFQIYKHQKFKNLVLKASHEIKDLKFLNILDKYKKKLDIKKDNIRIYKTNVNVSPFTTGILKPIIVIPDIEDNFKLEAAIYHELCHIKHNDGFILLLRNIMLVIYWFNPIVYFLNKSLAKNSELVCDERVVSDMSKDDRRKYGHFIIDISTKDLNRKYTNAFNNNKDIIKERLDYIMKPRKNSKKLAVVVAGILCFASITPAFAYDIPKVLHLEESLGEIDTLGSSEDFANFMSNRLEQDNITNEIFKNSVFIADDGTVYEYSGDTETQWLCKHSYESGVFQNHVTNGKGGCTMYYYEDAKRCKKCGIINPGELTYKIVFTKCPH